MIIIIVLTIIIVIIIILIILTKIADSPIIETIRLNRNSENNQLTYI